MIDEQRPRLQELQRFLANAIPCHPEEVRADLHAEPLGILLGRYLNWADRFIPAHPRPVYWWNGFLTHGLAKHHLPAVRAMQQRIAAGEDLTPFLSDKIERHGYVRPKIGLSGKRRGLEWEDKDYALNAYDVHHLHLGSRIKANGRSIRTQELLFASFDRKSAFLVMVGNHKSFDDGTLGKAVAEAYLATGNAIRGITGLSRSLTSLDRNRLQRRGVTSFAQVGTQVVPGAMLSAAGTSLAHTIYANAMMRTLDDLEPQLDDDDTVRKWFSNAGRTPPETLNCYWRMNHCDFGLLETSSSVFFPVCSWRR
jgi:hypothetical protein